MSSSQKTLLAWLFLAFSTLLFYQYTQEKERESSEMEISIQSFQLGDCLELKIQYDEFGYRPRMIVTRIGQYSYQISEYRAIRSEGCDAALGMCDKVLLFEDEKRYNRVSCQ